MKIAVIVNRAAGTGKKEKLLTVLTEKFRGSLSAVAETSCARQAAAIARGAADDGIDAVVAVGGDGTVNGVLNGLVGTDTPLGIVPAGTANDLASHYELPADVSKACEVILERHIQTLDVIDVNGWFYATAGGLGLPCRIARIADAIRYRSRWGKALGGIFKDRLYIIAAIYALLSAPARKNRLKLRCDDGPLVPDPLLLMINNQASVGGNFQISPGAINDDGRFDVCLIENLESRARSVATLFQALKGTHVDRPSVKRWRARELDIYADWPARFLADGEILESNTEFRIRILPRALHVITPRAAKSAWVKAA